MSHGRQINRRPVSLNDKVLAMHTLGVELGAFDHDEPETEQTSDGNTES